MLSSLLHSWVLFTVLFALLLITSFIMAWQSRFFYTKEVIVRRFSIMELELPGKPKLLTQLINGMYELLPENSAKAVKALKGNLWVDFLFMPAAYGCIFLLCMRVGAKFGGFGKQAFYVLAFLQIIPWICDIIENIYLLQKIHPNTKPSSPALHKTYLAMEGLKWGIALGGFICGFSAVCYCWLTGDYTRESLKYLAFCIIAVIIFLLLAARFLKKEEPDIQ